MSHLLVLVFFIEAVVHTVNAVGAAAINDLIWTAVNLLPIATSEEAKKKKKLQGDYLKVRGELNATSSQDEFAKWAKLRRQHDKLLEQLEAAKKNQEAARATFDKYLTAARLILTRAPQYIIPFWYGKEAMFWLPYGWFPYWAEWLISFPRAPLGSVSIASWQLACTGMVTLIGELVTGIGGLVAAMGRKQEVKEKQGKKMEEPVKAQSEKKEL